MKKNFKQQLACVAGILLLAAAGPAASQSHSHMMKRHGGAKHPSMMSYQEQRAACMNQTSRSVENCMREMGAARQAAQRGNLTQRDEDTYMKNRLARCDVLPASDREECVARMTMPTATSGSVAGGGILYESKEIVPAGTPGSKVIPGSAVVPGAVIVPRRALRP